MAGKTNGRAPRSLRWRTVAPTIVSMLAIPRLPAPTATVSPRLMATRAAARVSATVRGMSATRGRANVWRTRSIFGSMGLIMLYVWANFHADALRHADARSPPRPPADGRWLRVSQAAAHADPAARRAVHAGRAGARAQEVLRGARALPQDHRAPSQLRVGAARAPPPRRRAPPRGGVREGHQGVRDVPLVLPAPRDR